MLGMSAPEWSRYVHDELSVDLTPEEIDAAVVAQMLELYRRDLPLLPGAIEVVRSLAAHWPLGLASSSNREVISAFLELADLDEAFVAYVSSEEVGQGKPAPAVYLEAARRVAVDPEDCVAIEDSSNGLRAASSAGMAVIAVPNPDFPPAPDALALAAVAVAAIGDVTPDVVERAASGGGRGRATD
jgi:HAD superfamily hydrolase (TIGR01509 family)